MRKLLSLILAGLTCLNMSVTVLAQEPTNNDETNTPAIEEPVDDGSEENTVPTDPQNPVAPCEEKLPGGDDECF